MSSPAPDLKYHILTHPVPNVAHVQLNRPEKLNAFHEPMWTELGALFRHLSSDPSTRAVVLSGRGPRAFSAGLDVKAAAQSDLLGPSSGEEEEEKEGGKKKPDGARTAHRLLDHITAFQAAVSAVEQCRKPVVAVLHAVAFGLAVDVACCADVRVAVAGVRCAVKEVDIGLAADIGSLARLPKVVGHGAWVREVCLTAREFGAEEALRVGFVSRVYQTLEEGVEGALGMAGAMAEKSPVAVVGTKELLRHARDHSVEDSRLLFLFLFPSPFLVGWMVLADWLTRFLVDLRYTAVWNSAMLQSDDVQAALLSGMTKTKPTFEKL